MDRESRSAAAIIQAKAKPGDTIFIWGYRPDIVAYTRLPVAGRIWDSQPATGVPADRHLSDSRPVSAEWAQKIRAELAQSKPAFLVDGLSRYNAALDIHAYPDLAEWLAHYCEAGTTGGIVIYSRCK
jgi:transposase